MKDFNQFLSEMPRPVQQAKRLGLQGDGHGGWHNRKTGEFVAKTENGQLTFYNKRQRIGRRDPAQTEREKRLSATSYEEIRDLYVKGEIFNEGDWIKSEVTEQVGKIIRRGANYLICVTEDNEMFKPWIKDVTNVSTMVKESDWVKQFINKYRKK